MRLPIFKTTKNRPFTINITEEVLLSCRVISYTLVKKLINTFTSYFTKLLCHNCPAIIKSNTAVRPNVKDLFITKLHIKIPINVSLFFFFWQLNQTENIACVEIGKIFESCTGFKDR